MEADFRLGPWRVEPGLNRISCNGSSLRLEPKVMEVLVCLAGQPGEPVTKKQLLRTVWPDTFVSDDVLTRSISELRRVFADDAKDAHFIQTIPKRGYRLIAPVVGVEQVPPTRPSKPPIPEAIPGSPRHERIRVFALVAGAVLFLGLLAWLKATKIAEWVRAKSRPQIQSLAVLPLQNLSGDPSQEYFADAMTEELITELSRISALKVISRTSIMRYKKADKGLPEIARELGVDGIVEGSVLRSGNRVRVTAQLIYAPKDTNIWVQTYDRDLQDVLALQATVASAIAEEIRVTMKPHEKEQLRTRRPVNLKAHEAYMQGRYHLQLEWDSVFKKDSIKLAAAEAKEAERDFHLAIQEDPNYAPPYLGIWEVLVASPVPGREWVPQAKEQLFKALQRDDSLAEAHARWRPFYSLIWTSRPRRGSTSGPSRLPPVIQTPIPSTRIISPLLKDEPRRQWRNTNWRKAWTQRMIAWRTRSITLANLIGPSNSTKLRHSRGRVTSVRTSLSQTSMH